MTNSTDHTRIAPGAPLKLDAAPPFPPVPDMGAWCPHLDVHTYTTPKCNLGCPHCYFDALQRGDDPGPLFSMALLREVLIALSERFIVENHLEGGEPLLRDDLRSFLESLPPQVLKTIVITTNGTVRIPMEPAILKRLGGLRVSIDGHTDDLNLELRTVGLRPILRTCRKLDEDDVPYTVRTTLWSGNVRSLRDILRFTAANGISNLSLYEFQASGRGVGTQLLYGVNDSAWAAFLRDLTTVTVPEELATFTISAADRRVSDILAADDRLRDNGFEVVQLPEVASITISTDGSVGISAWDVTAGGPGDGFAHISDDSFVDRLVDLASRGELIDRSSCTTRVRIEKVG